MGYFGWNGLERRRDPPFCTACQRSWDGEERRAPDPRLTVLMAALRRAWVELGRFLGRG
jgi:hypothetical protein